MPERIQLSRAKGWRKPEGVVVVARPTKWGNPFVPSNEGHSFWYVTAWGRHFGCERDREGAVRLAVELYRAAYARHRPLTIGDDLPDPAELAGRDLACWCPLDQPCHADVLLELANGRVPVGEQT